MAKQTNPQSTRARKRAKAPPLPGGLLNWPPSRGPMPARLKALYEPLRFEFEKPAIEFLQGRVRPPKRVPVVVTPPRTVLLKQAKKKMGRRARYVFSFQGMVNQLDVQVEFDCRVAVGVVEIARVRVEAASELISGMMMRTPFGGTRRTRPSWVSHLPTRALVFDLTYPLSDTARVTIKPYTIRTAGLHGRRGRVVQRMDVGYVLWQLAQAYKQIYRAHRRYGVWGHAIGDLHFSGLRIRDQVGHVEMSS